MKLIAHGGYSAKFPENTLEGYLAADKFAPFAIEMDIVLDPKTKKPICYHPKGPSPEKGIYSDDHVKRDLKEQAPFLSDTLKRLSPNTKVVLDLKHAPEVSMEKILEDSNIKPTRLIVAVRDMQVHDHVKNLNPDIETLALFRTTDEYKKYKEHSGEYFRLWEHDVAQELVDAIHAEGLEVWVTPGHWATDTQPRTSGEIDKETLKRFQDIGIDGVLVNDIGLTANPV